VVPIRWTCRRNRHSGVGGVEGEIWRASILGCRWADYGEMALRKALVILESAQ